MVLSYSAAARPTADTPSVISLVSPTPAAKASPAAPAKPADAADASETPAAGPSKLPSPSLGSGINHIILDAGPLLSLAPLRHLAQRFHTTPMVLAELRDPKARQHWVNLGLSGVEVKVEAPHAEAMSKVMDFARKTGDLAVLSATDLSVIALTYQYELRENGEKNIRTEPASRRIPTAPTAEASTANGGHAGSTSNGPTHNEHDKIEEEDEEEDDEDDTEEGESSAEEEVDEPETETAEVEDASRSIEQVLLDDPTALTETDSNQQDEPSFGFKPESQLQAESVDQEEDEESDGGEWITPSNVQKHRSHDLGLLPADNGTGDASETIAAACMTGDFAVQNVLLGMGLGLVGEGGKRIGKVKSFVLRCHACFKLCKDPTKRFCPSCGNPSLLRTTVTTSAKTGQQKIHLKKNFQYHLRGSKYTIPDAKPGRAKGQLKGGTGLILREDQAEWQDAVRSQEMRKRKEEKKVAKGALEGWNDPDWLPEIITVGMSGKGRSGAQGMPTIGHGRKNPNQARRKR